MRPSSTSSRHLADLTGSSLFESISSLMSSRHLRTRKGSAVATTSIRAQALPFIDFSEDNPTKNLYKSIIGAGSTISLSALNIITDLGAKDGSDDCKNLLNFFADQAIYNGALVAGYGIKPQITPKYIKRSLTSSSPVEARTGESRIDFRKLLDETYKVILRRIKLATTPFLMKIREDLGTRNLSIPFRLSDDECSLEMIHAAFCDSNFYKALEKISEDLVNLLVAEDSKLDPSQSIFEQRSRESYKRLIPLILRDLYECKTNYFRMVESIYDRNLIRDVPSVTISIAEALKEWSLHSTKKLLRLQDNPADIYLILMRSYQRAFIEEILNLEPDDALASLELDYLREQSARSSFRRCFNEYYQKSFYATQELSSKTDTDSTETKTIYKGKHFPHFINYFLNGQNFPRKILTPKVISKFSSATNVSALQKMLEDCTFGKSYQRRLNEILHKAKTCLECELLPRADHVELKFFKDGAETLYDDLTKSDKATLCLASSILRTQFSLKYNPANTPVLLLWDMPSISVSSTTFTALWEIVNAEIVSRGAQVVVRTNSFSLSPNPGLQHYTNFFMIERSGGARKWSISKTCSIDDEHHFSGLDGEEVVFESTLGGALSILGGGNPTTDQSPPGTAAGGGGRGRS